MKQQLNLIYRYFTRIYKLSLSSDKQDLLAWKALKKMHVDAGWKSGVYEKGQYIETVFEIGEEKAGVFNYMILDREYHCRVNILENFMPEMATDFFILAAHFNNLLNKGKVEINVNDRTVEYNYKSDLLVPLLYPGEFHNRMLKHYYTSKDVYWAFNKLIYEKDEPAIIIADLLKKNETQESES